MADVKQVADLTSDDNITQEKMNDDVIIDIEAMTKISDDGLLSPTLCIYKVPQSLRDMKPDAYTPKVVSIGPFHYGKARLQEMERHKQIMFKRFTQKAGTSLDDLVSFVKDSEPKVRASYSENINLSKKQLVKLILVDAIFVNELFSGIYHWGKTTDAKLSQPRMSSDIERDLLLLENQLPFFFLEELYNRVFPLNVHGVVPSFLLLTYAFFRSYNIQDLERDSSVGIKHFADLLRFYHLPITKPPRKPFSEARDHILLYSAKELHESGVKLKASTSKCLLDLKFSEHTLEVPYISVQDSTENFFRNVIALEQCHYPLEPYITDYAILLDQIMNTNKDVDILIHNKIVGNSLGDTNDVVEVFNGLRKEVDRYNINSDYVDICRRLNGFYQDPWHKRKATLRRDYCRTPWQTVASIAGIILLILTIIQTIFSILQVALK